MKDWMTRSWRLVVLYFGNWRGWVCWNRSRSAAEGRRSTSLCAFRSEEEFGLSVDWWFRFCEEETSTAISMIKEEKTGVQKIVLENPLHPRLVRMFWGRFRTRSDSIGLASQRPRTRENEWPDQVRSTPAPDTFPDSSLKLDSSRFARALNLPKSPYFPLHFRLSPSFS